MSVAAAAPAAGRLRSARELRRAAPAAVAGALALVYLLSTPASSDLAAALLRVKLYHAAGFSLWDNWWYGGHYTLSYSVLFSPLAAAGSPQLIGALAAVAAGALFEPLARGAFGEQGWLGACWFAAGSAAQLYSGRLTFVLGLAFAVAATLALQRRRGVLAAGCAVLCALSSPVAAVFAALAGLAACSLDAARVRAGCAVAVAALAPVLALALIFPQTGSEPFALSALAPIPPLAAALALLAGRRRPALAAGALLYGAGCVLAYAIPTALGGNAVRLGALAAGPAFALLLYPRRRAWLTLCAPLLLYLQLQAPVRDLLASARSPTAGAAYWRPLLSFLRRQPDRPFRVEIPFTALHWESYYVAAQFPLARGWERQLDTGDDRLFYARGGLSPVGYERWLHALAVRYVALVSAPLDYSARAEASLVRHGLPYLRLVWRTRTFSVYEVRGATPLAQGAAVATALGPDSVTLRARRSGSSLVRVRYSPYWALTEGAGCVAPAGSFTRLTLWRAGPVRLTISFALGRIGARSPRCTAAASRARRRPTP